MKPLSRTLWISAILTLSIFTTAALGEDQRDALARQETAQKPPTKIVKIGGYDFPPYVEKESGKFSGLTLDLIKVINSLQSKYLFEFVPTSSLRRYQDFLDGVYDAIFFESAEWGWKGLPIEASRVFAQDREVLLAKALPGRNQTYFDDLTGKALRVYFGYHYPFAHFNADPAYLLREFNARTTVSHEANIRSVIAGRADVAVVTDAFLQKYLRDNPARIPRCLVSDRIVQTYHHTILVREHVEPSVGEINALLDHMDRAGYLSLLLGKYGIQRTLPLAPRERAPEQPVEVPTEQVAKSTIVKVGGYHFPPYVERVSAKFTGLTLDLLELMNAFQSKYRFVFVPTTSLTRYEDFDDRAFDMVFFERKEWGWADRPIDSSREFLKDHEVYVTRADAGKTPKYFDTLEGKTLRGYLGYHYPSAAFETDPGVLLQRYNLRVTESHEENLRAVLERRADVAIVTKSFTVRYLRNNPAVIPRLLISDRVEQDYRHTILVRAGTKPSAQDIMGILSELDRAGYSSLLWGKYDVATISESP